MKQKQYRQYVAAAFNVSFFFKFANENRLFYCVCDCCMFQADVLSRVKIEVAQHLDAAGPAAEDAQDVRVIFIFATENWLLYILI